MRKMLHCIYMSDEVQLPYLAASLPLERSGWSCTCCYAWRDSMIHGHAQNPLRVAAVKQGQAKTKQSKQIQSSQDKCKGLHTCLIACHYLLYFLWRRWFQQYIAAAWPIQKNGFRMAGVHCLLSVSWKIWLQQHCRAWGACFPSASLSGT